MKKGDRRREEVIETAERLFYSRGYEKTSVQDILDEMHFSKGGFYHHFESKLQLLEAICEMRTHEIWEQAKKQAEGNFSKASERLNAVLSHSALWNAASPGFVSLLIGVAYREDGALMREKMKNCQLQGMLPLVTEIIWQGCKSGEFYSPDPSETASVVLRLYMQFTDEIAFLLASDANETEMLERMIHKLWVYRGALERILVAPLGSLVLFDSSELTALVRKILTDRRMHPVAAPMALERAE